MSIFFLYDTANGTGLYTGIQVNIPVITGNCPIIVRCNDEHDFTGSYIVHTLF